MNRIIAAASGVVLALSLAACAGGGHSSAPAPSKTPRASSTSANAEASDAASPADTPNCASLVGSAEADVLGANHQPTCSVVPGSTGILYGTTSCVGESNVPVYFWTATDDDDPHHNVYQVYAIREGGTLGVVADAASLYAALGGVPGLNYMQAAGCPGMATS